jgi:alpha-glucosidase
VVGFSQDPAAGTRARGPVDLAQGHRYARSAILMLLALPGSVYLYQGEELGLPEVMDLPLAARQDPIVKRSGGKDLGRDGCRVPIPWEHEEPSFGFSLTEPAAAPWLPQPAWFGQYAVDLELADPSSFLSLYRLALQLRREHFAARAADLEWIDLPGRADALAFRRGSAVCLVNCGASPFDLPTDWGQVVLASAPVQGRTASPASAVWLRAD